MQGKKRHPVILIGYSGPGLHTYYWSPYQIQGLAGSAKKVKAHILATIERAPEHLYLPLETALLLQNLIEKEEDERKPSSKYMALAKKEKSKKERP